MTNGKSFISALLVALGVLTFTSSAWADCGFKFCDPLTEKLNTITCLCEKTASSTVCIPTSCNLLTEKFNMTTCKCEKNTSSISMEKAREVISNTDSAKSTASASGSTTNSGSFCSSDLGIFSELVQTGKIIFNRLRDLIYVVAGFGIIAVAVGGFFGNLNWKWLGAIVISLVVIATAGELVVALTGCEAFSSSLVTNTLTKPSTAMSSKELARLWATNDQTTEGSTITDSAGSDNKVEENKEGNDENKEAAEGNNENKEASEGNNENKEASEQKDTVKVERGSAAGLSQELSSYTQLSIDTPKTLSLP